MEYVIYILIAIVGIAIGYLVCNARLSASKASENALRERIKELQQEHQQQLTSLQKDYKERIATMQADQQTHDRRLQTEFENLSNRIFKSKAEDFSRLNAEKMSALLAPFGKDLNDFRSKFEKAYDDEAKERFSLSKELKELTEMNSRLSQDADNLSKALKGESKTQGNWGEMILEHLLESSGLKEGEHYVRQEFLKDGDDKIVNEESGKKMQPDVIVHFPGDRDMIIDSKVSLTAYLAYTEAEDDENKTRQAKAHLLSVKAHVDELSRKDYSRYDAKSPDFVMMFIPNEGAYLLAIQTDKNLWEYAYSRKVILMSPTNLISALRLSLDLWKREVRIKNVEEIIHRATLLYERIASFGEKFLTIGDKMTSLRNEYDEALNQLSESSQSVTNQAKKLCQLGLSPKKQISQKLTNNNDD